MKTGLIFVISLILMCLASCGQAATPTAAIPTTPTAIPTSTATPTPTATATPTPTITPTPTPIGATEPKIAFVGKDSQGQLGIYIDGLYTGKPEKISPLTVPEENAPYLPMRWSPDGTRLIFENRNELNRSSFFLFDAGSKDIRELAPIPSGKYVFDFMWSPDGNLYFAMASTGSRSIFLGELYHKLDLSNGQISKAYEIYPIASNSHVNSSGNCNQSTFSKTVSDLTMGGMGGFGRSGAIYDNICFYPELNAYAGLKYSEDTTDFVLITEEGQVSKILVTFPAKFGLNGWMDLSLSPDRSQLLVIGQGSVESFGNGCCQIVYPIKLSGPATDLSDLKIWEGWPHFNHVFGWSPDNMNYLIAERNWNTANPEDRFEIIQASSGEVVYEYKIQSPVSAAFSIGQVITGYDMVWPASP